MIDPWMQATRYGRVDFAEVCCTSDSLQSGAVTSHGGRGVQHSHWNGFDLATKAGTEQLKGDLLEKRPRAGCCCGCCYRCCCCCCKLALQFSWPPRELAHLRCANAAMFSCSVTLLVWERFAVAAAAAARAVFQSRRSAMQVVNMR